MKGQLNPPLKEGDVVVCYHMDGETSVPPGTRGTVRSLSRDPFEPAGELIYNVNWENGSTLGLLSTTDAWKKVEEKPKEKVQESKGTGLPSYDYFSQNPEVFENFDWRFLREFLKKLRDAGPVNMFESTPFLYSGKDWIDRYYGEGQEDNDDFQEVLEMADEAKNKMVQGVLKYMKSEGIEIELEKVNRLVQNFAKKILQLYISFF